MNERIDAAFAELKNAFPTVATWQGTHFKYASGKQSVLIERKIADRFFYWLLVDGHFCLIHASRESKLAPMRTIGDSLTPSPSIS